MIGTEIINAALVTALKEKKMGFTKEEFDDFKVSNLNADSYIKVGDDHFKPAESDHGNFTFPGEFKRGVARLDFRDVDPGWPHWEEIIHVLNLQKATSDVDSDMESSRMGLMEMAIDHITPTT